MLLRRGIAPKVFMNVGLGSLLLAETTQFVIRHTHRSASDVADGVIGFFFGVSIASMLVWVATGRRKPR